MTTDYVYCFRKCILLKYSLFVASLHLLGAICVPPPDTPNVMSEVDEWTANIPLVVPLKAVSIDLGAMCWSTTLFLMMIVIKCH